MPALTPRLRGLVIILGLFAFGVAGTLIITNAGLDLSWTGYFYHPDGKYGGWVYGRDFPWGVLYDYGEIPTFVILAFAVILYAASWKGKARPLYRGACLAVILTVIIGPGILVNGILKTCWGRPRPAEVSQFGGPWEYRKPWEIGTPGQGKSFPCGHCSMAFAMGSAAAFYPLHPALAVAAVIGGVAYGMVMGVARIAQGGHFATDVLWSGVIVFALIAVLYYWVLRIPQEHDGLKRGAPDRLEK